LPLCWSRRCEWVYQHHYVTTYDLNDLHGLLASDCDEVSRVVVVAGPEREYVSCMVKDKIHYS
jgi:hypothetical protein